MHSRSLLASQRRRGAGRPARQQRAAGPALHSTPRPHGPLTWVASTLSVESGSSDSTRTVPSNMPTARKRQRCRPSGTGATSTQATSPPISRFSLSTSMPYGSPGSGAMRGLLGAPGPTAGGCSCHTSRPQHAQQPAPALRPGPCSHSAKCTTQSSKVGLNGSLQPLAPPPPPPPRPHLRVELEVDNLAARQRDGHLPLVGGRLDDGLAPRRAPLIDAPVGADVAQAGGVDLRLGGGGATSRGPAAGQHAGRAPRRAGNSMHRHRLDGLLGACRRLALTLPTSVFSPCGSACSHQEPPSPACAPEASSRRPAAGCAGWARCR